MTESESTQNQDIPTENPPASEAKASTAAAGADGTSSAVDLEGQLAAAKQEASENYNRYLRAVADLENFRKRAVREKDELRQYAAGRVLEDLIPVLDSLGLGQLAAKKPNAEVSGIVSGMDMVINQLKNALSAHGLKEINPEGQAFDPHQHEAISHLPSPKVPADQVLSVVRTGYSLNGRLLRPASVVVSSGPAAPESA